MKLTQPRRPAFAVESGERLRMFCQFSMSKKIIFSIIVISILAVGGFFCWWQNGAELRELNKNLPDGIRVVQRNGSQVVINQKDGYEIKVPEGWGGLEKVRYKEIENNQEKYLLLEGNNGVVIEMRQHTINEVGVEEWLEKQKEGLKNPRFGDFTIFLGEEKIGNYEILKLKNESPIVGTIFTYLFKKDSQIYEIYTDCSEESIRDVILNGTF